MKNFQHIKANIGYSFAMSRVVRKIPVLVCLALYSCSPIHYRSDLVEIREVYDESQDKIDLVEKKRAQSISEKSTVFSRKIACLSEPYRQVAISRAEKQSARIDRLFRSTARKIDRKNAELKKLLHGGYEKIVRNSSGKTIEKRRYERGIYDLATDIKVQSVNVENMGRMEAQISPNTEARIRELDRKNIDLFYLKEKRQKVDSELEALKAKKKEYSDMRNKYSDMSKSGSGSVKTGMKFAVANIYDKTEKVYSVSSTAISDIVEHALTYNKAISVVNSPYGEKFSYSRYNPLHNKSDSKSLIEPRLQLMSDYSGFAGAVFPSDVFISGALVQYDEATPIKPFGTSFNVNAGPASIDSSTKTITVGLILRAVDSRNSSVIDNAELEFDEENAQSDKSSVYLQNTFFVKKLSGEIFKIVSEDLYGGDLSVEVADPVHYAVREMTEKATYMVLKQTLPRNAREVASIACDSI